MPRTISRELHNGMDIIDSRDVIARIEYLTNERESFAVVLADAQAIAADNPANPETAAETVVTAEEALQEWDDDHGDELKDLQALANEAEGVADWIHGESLIRDSYFEDYAQEMAADIGAISPDAKWPVNHIDWDAAADELKQDYRSISFGDETYWIRG